MLEKTFALLNDIPGGTYVPDEKKCYDDAEIEQLSQILKRLLWAPSQIRKKLQQAGVTIIPCNFYSEIPSIDRKSTRLNSSHQIISYAVFCLKKKTNKTKYKKVRAI